MWVLAATSSLSRNVGNSLLFRVALLSLCCLAMACVPQFVYAADEQPWRVEFKTRFMVNSHTSYEFGNPFSPFQAPLSRLEFDMDSFWTGFEARRSFGRLSVGVGFLSTFRDQNAGHMRDSDWEDDAIPTRLSIFSASDCRMRPSYQVNLDVDAQVADLLHLPASVDLRPVIGFRGQQLRFMAHDGVQYEYDAAGNIIQTDPIPGDSIKFKQNWYQSFLGVRLGYEWAKPPLLHRLRFNSQWDWSYVVGKNRDDHLLRGDRVTRDETDGHAWHGMVGVALGLTEQLDLDVEVDHLRIETTGTHKHIDKTHGFFLNFQHGVKAWSEQTSVSVNLAYRF